MIKTGEKMMGALTEMMYAGVIEILEIVQIICKEYGTEGMTGSRMFKYLR